MKIYKIKSGILIEESKKFFLLTDSWDQFINRSDLYEFALQKIKEHEPAKDAEVLLASELQAPIGNQEIWASGVTYYKSRDARMDESKTAGGGSFYDRVYNADRPELFFKSTASRAVGPAGKVRIRKDSNWNVPEPEVTLLISSAGDIIGYTIGNDMSSRDIEGENPLYLPQAKSYDGSAAIGPCVLVTKEPISPDSFIRMEILRNKKVVFEGEIQISQIKRTFKELVHYLCLEMSFPAGAYLMTGTGIIPPNDFSLKSGDEIRITIDQIGTLVNTVE